MGWLVLIGYGIAINAICFLLRRVQTGDDYLIGGRRFSALFVSFGLFTLLGGGTFVANTSLGYALGLYGFALFFGNGIGFAVLGLLSGRIRALYSEYLPISIVDYFFKRFGLVAGWVGFLVTFLAFFGLLTMQFIAAGDLLQPILHIPYIDIVAAVGVIATSYLVLTGFRAVMSTDLLQGVIIVLLIPTLIFMAKPGVAIAPERWLPPRPDWVAVIGLAYAGFISAMASSDVWQRAFAARDVASSRTGFLIGAGVISLLGLMLILLGVFAAATGATNADEAFSYMMQSRLPQWAYVPVSLMVLAVIISTIDTEIFLLGGLAERQAARLQGHRENELAQASHLGRSRLWVATCAATAGVCAAFYKDLVALYGWLLSLSLIIGPITFASLVFKVPAKIAAAALLLNCAVFVVAAAYNLVSVDNSYIIAVPSTIILIGVGVFNWTRRATLGQVRSND